MNIKVCFEMKFQNFQGMQKHLNRSMNAFKEGKKKTSVKDSSYPQTEKCSTATPDYHKMGKNPTEACVQEKRKRYLQEHTFI